MPWTPPTGVIPTDRKSPSVPTMADIPAMLDWLRDYYPGNTVIGVLATARAERMTYRVDGEPGYGTPGTLSNYTLTKLDWGRDEIDAALADIPDQVAAGLAPVDAALEQVADIIADTAQSAADAAAAAGLIPTAATSTTLPSGAGNYRIMSGPEAGQVWTRATNGAAPERNLKLEPLSRAGQTAVQPEWYDGTDLTAALTAAVAALPAEGGTIDAQKWTGTHTLTANPFASTSKRISLITGNLTMQFNPQTVALRLPNHFRWRMTNTTVQSSVDNPLGGGALIAPRAYTPTATTTAGSPVVTLSSTTDLEVGSVVLIVAANGPHAAASGTLSAALGAADTTGSVTQSGTGLNGTTYYQIDSEIVLATITGGSITDMQRGQLGTAAAAHASGAAMTWLQSLWGEVLAINGNTVTLDTPATLSVTGAGARYGCRDIQITGSGVLDGKKLDGVDTPNFSPLIWGYSSDCTLRGEFTIRGGDHGGAYFGQAKNCLVDVAEIHNCGRPDLMLGSGVWIFGLNDKNILRARRIVNCQNAIIIDDRSTRLTVYGGEGAPTDNLVEIGEIDGVDPYGITISGGTNNHIHVRRVGAGIFPGNLVEGDGQWNTPVPCIRNVIEVDDHADAAPTFTGDAAVWTNTTRLRGAVTQVENPRLLKPSPYDIKERPSGATGAFGGTIYRSGGQIRGYANFNFDALKFVWLKSDATEVFSIDAVNGFTQLTLPAPYHKINRAAGSSSGYGGLWFQDNNITRAYGVYDYGQGLFAWLDASAAVVATLNVATGAYITKGGVSAASLTATAAEPTLTLNRTTGVYSGMKWQDNGTLKSQFAYDHTADRVVLLDGAGAEVFGVNPATGQARITGNSPYLNINRKGGGNGGYAGVQYTDNLANRAYAAYEWSASRFVWLDSAAAVQASLTTTGILNIKRLQVASPNVPASATAAGTAGEIAWDANYVYVCVAANTWKRTALSSW